MKRIKSYHLFLLVITVTAVCYGYKPSIAANIETNPKMLPISCDLSCYQESRRVWSEVTFSNATEATVPVFVEALLKVKRLEGIGFWVTKDGQNVPYQGILIKRPPPGIDEFYPMKPHEVSKAKVEISKYFDFSKAGEYVIGYSCITAALPLNGTNLLKIESYPVVLKRK